MALHDLVYYSDRALALRYAVHRITIWKWAGTGRLPKPTKLGPKTSRWRSDDIEAHEAALASNSAKD